MGYLISLTVYMTCHSLSLFQPLTALLEVHSFTATAMSTNSHSIPSGPSSYSMWKAPPMLKLPEVGYTATNCMASAVPIFDFDSASATNTDIPPNAK